MKRLAAVDDTLKALGTPNIYRQLHAYVKRLLIGWIVATYIGNICDSIWWFYAVKDRRCMIIPYIINHFNHVNIFEDILFITFLWFVLYYISIPKCNNFVNKSTLFIVLIRVFYKIVITPKKEQYIKEDNIF